MFIIKHKEIKLPYESFPCNAITEMVSNTIDVEKIAHATISVAKFPPLPFSIMQMHVRSIFYSSLLRRISIL